MRSIGHFQHKRKSGFLNIPMPEHADEMTARGYLQGLLVVFWFGLTFIPAFTIFDGSSLRFIVYTLPIVSVFAWMVVSKGAAAFDYRYVIATSLYAALILTNLVLVNPIIDKDTWANLLRPVFYLGVFIPFLVFDHRSVNWMVIIFLLTTIGLALVGKSESSGGFDLAASQGPLESGLAFPLGGVLLYSFMYKRKFFGFIAFILFVVAFKRIAFAALFAIGGIYIVNLIIRMLFPISERYLLYVWVMLAAIATVMVNLYYYDFFSSVAAMTGSNKSVDELTMGRLREFQILYGQYGYQDLLHILFGNGPGDSTRKLVEVTIKYPLQVHNSFLIYYYDYGVIGFFFMMMVYFILYSRNALGMYLFIYNLLLMVTDQNFIHHYHQITYMILIGAAHYQNQLNRERRSGRME